MLFYCISKMIKVFQKVKQFSYITRFFVMSASNSLLYSIAPKNGSMITEVSVLDLFLSCTIFNNPHFFTVPVNIKKLFALFINDLVPEINSLNCGISVDDDFSLSTLLYADDIVFLASTAEGLQEQLETLNNWSTKWALNVNIDKTKVFHVRKASVARCEYRLKLGDLVVDYTSQ